MKNVNFYLKIEKDIPTKISPESHQKPTVLHLLSVQLDPPNCPSILSPSQKRHHDTIRGEKNKKITITIKYSQFKNEFHFVILKIDCD